MPKIYNITITENQLRVISEALDFWYRIQMGQFKEILQLFADKYPNRFNNWSVSRLFAGDCLVKAKKELFPNITIDCYLGISSPDLHDDCRTAADMYDDILGVIRPEKHTRLMKWLMAPLGKEPELKIEETDNA